MTMYIKSFPSTRRAVSPGMILSGVTIGAMMAFLDATMVNIALNDMQSDMRTDLSTASWILNAYNLAFALALIPGGRLADQFGRKRLFVIGLLLFGMGSEWCAFASSITWLIAARGIQGAGGALLSAVGLANISAAFRSGKQRNTAFGIWGAANGLAIAVGPVLGGLLVQFLDWRWIFLVNLPLCVISLAMVLAFVQETSDMRASKRIDVPGLLLLSGTLVGLVLIVLQGNAWGWLSVKILLLLAGTLSGFVAFVIVELLQDQPIVNFRLFVERRGFAMGNMSMLLFAIALMGAFVIMVLFLRSQGSSPLVAALLLLPTPLTSFLVSLLAGKLALRISPHAGALLGLALLSLGLLSLTTLVAPITIWEMLWREVLSGTGMGLCFFSLPTLTLKEIPPAQSGQASGIFALSQQTGFTLGVAILTSVLSSLPDLYAFAITWTVAGWFAIGGFLFIMLGLS
jgi:EmrB/QacA subfamily drug resistance transporter